MAIPKHKFPHLRIEDVDSILAPLYDLDLQETLGPSIIPGL